MCLEPLYSNTDIQDCLHSNSAALAANPKDALLGLPGLGVDIEDPGGA